MDCRERETTPSNNNDDYMTSPHASNSNGYMASPDASNNVDDYMISTDEINALHDIMKLTKTALNDKYLTENKADRPREKRRRRRRRKEEGVEQNNANMNYSLSIFGVISLWKVLCLNAVPAGTLRPGDITQVSDGTTLNQGSP